MNSRLILKTQMIAAMILFAGSSIWSQGQPPGSVRLSLRVTSPSITYSTTNDVEGTGAITVQKKGGSNTWATTDFYVVFTLVSLTSTATSGGENLSYGLYKSSSSNTAISLTGRPSSSDDVISGSIKPQASSTSLSYVFRVSNVTFPAPGTYTARITAKVYIGSFTSGMLGNSSASATITVRITVGKSASVAIVGGASDSFPFTSASADPNYSLSLGNLEANTTNTAYILVRSNTGYNLALSSMNGGNLVNIVDGSTIAYVVSLGGGSSYSLSTASTSLISGSATYSTPASHSLAVTIPEYGTPPSAGDYTDTIVVTVAAW